MRSYSLFFFAVTILSCSNNTYENYHSFSDEGWNTDSVIKFKYNILDIETQYDLILKIRHTVDYDFQNLFVFLNDINRDTFEITLADKSGRWLGKGVSDIRQFEYLFYSQRKFATAGEQVITIEHAMRYGSAKEIEVLENILDIGLIVSEHND
jgi:gliding motility-associated lipoprotein GldH